LCSTCPGGDPKDNLTVAGYSMAQTLVQVLTQAGDELTRDNVMKQAASLDMTLPMLLPGVTVKTGSDDFYPVEREQLKRFNGKSWELFGKVYGR
jgi:branched-chain amino acid transport system substrate-binding protein